MPFCPECLSEFREGYSRCNSCDKELVDRIPEEMDLSEESVRKALDGKKLQIVTRGFLDVIKETRDLLAHHSIASLIVDDEETRQIPGASQRVALAVPADDLESVAKILGTQFQQMVAQEGGAVGSVKNYDTCPACNSRVSENLEECPECGLFVGKA